MQVSPVGPTVPATIAGHAGLLLLPHLLRLTSLSPKTQALREQHQAEREEDDRRQRDASAEANQTAAAAAADARPTFAEVTAEAERKMAPGSRAAQRQIANEEQQKTTLQRDKFQRTLADAAARENAKVEIMAEVTETALLAASHVAAVEALLVARTPHAEARLRHIADAGTIGMTETVIKAGRRMG